MPWQRQSWKIMYSCDAVNHSEHLYNDMGNKEYQKSRAWIQVHLKLCFTVSIIFLHFHSLPHLFLFYLVTQKYVELQIDKKTSVAYEEYINMFPFVHLKLEHRESKKLAQRQATGKWKTQDSDPGISISKSIIPNIPISLLLRFPKIRQGQFLQNILQSRN